MVYKKYKNIEYLILFVPLILNLINLVLDEDQLKSIYIFYSLLTGHLAIIPMYCMLFFSRRRDYPYRKAKSFWVLPMMPRRYIYLDFKFIVSRWSFCLLNIISVISLIYYIRYYPIFKIGLFGLFYVLSTLIVVLICILLKFYNERKNAVHTSIYMFSMILLIPLLANDFIPLEFYRYYPLTSLVVITMEEWGNLSLGVIFEFFVFIVAVFYVYKKISNNWLI